MKKLLLLCFLACSVWTAGVCGAAVPPPPRQWVTDPGDFLSPGAAVQINAELKRFQELTGNQVVVWIGTTTGNASLEDWATDTFRSWRIGQKGKDNGVALFIFSKDRKVRIESGYGVEGKLPDLLVSRIIREILVPGFRSAQRDQAVAGAVAVMMKALDARAAAEVLSGTAPTGANTPIQQRRRKLGIVQIIIFIILGIGFLFLLVTHPTLALWLLFSFVSGGGGRGGGGFSGGGFSGGGGLSGGGGASGSW